MSFISSRIASRIAGFITPRVMAAFNPTPPVPPTEPVTTWDAATKGVNMTLSGSDRSATNTSSPSWSSVTSTTAKSTGSLRAEYLVTQTPGNRTVQIFGFGSGIGANNYLNNSGDVGGIRGNGEQMIAGTVSAAGTLATVAISAGDVLTLEIDFGAKKAWIAINGDFGTGNPGTGANPHFTWTGTPTFNLGYSNSNVASCLTTLRTHSSQFTTTASSGFTGWDP